MIRYRAYILDLDTCEKVLLGTYTNRFAAIKSANEIRTLNNECVIVQQFDEIMDRWFTVYSKFKRGW